MSNSTSSAAVAVPVPALPDIKSWPLVAASLLLAVGAWYLADTVSGKQAALYLVGAVMGATLYHAAFGFTSSWRVFIADGRGAGLRAQMLMLAIACALFFPALASGSLFGAPVTGLVAPVGVSVAVGAFIFGVGMQLGGGCASGTLYTAGGGNTRMLVTLAAFVVGSVIATAHLHWWSALPHIAPTSLVKELGAAPALALSLTVFAVIAAITVLVERKVHGRLLRKDGAKGWARLLRGPWPLVAGAVLLAVLNYATLALAGRPWGVTSAFALWGAKASLALGLDVSAWPFWQGAANKAALAAPVANDITSVMDIGIMVGALAAAALAGKFAPVWKLPLKSLAAAVIGGLLLGYGSRLAFGCNIGAYFSGIASGSLHGWLWLVAAFAGNAAGTRLRPLFGLEVERTPRETGC
jgi:uncharacterized membrane protein YedE/YeeE